MEIKNELEKRKESLQRSLEYYLQTIECKVKEIWDLLKKDDLTGVWMTARSIGDFATDIEVDVRAMLFLQKHGDKNK